MHELWPLWTTWIHVLHSQQQLVHDRLGHLLGLRVDAVDLLSGAGQPALEVLLLALFIVLDELSPGLGVLSASRRQLLVVGAGVAEDVDERLPMGVVFLVPGRERVERRRNVG